MQAGYNSSYMNAGYSSAGGQTDAESARLSNI